MANDDLTPYDEVFVRRWIRRRGIGYIFTERSAHFWIIAAIRPHQHTDKCICTHNAVVQILVYIPIYTGVAVVSSDGRLPFPWESVSG